MPREEWLKHRLCGIGGSEIAAVCGISKYKTPLDIYNEKLGLIPPFEGNARTEAGNRLENTVAEWYADETGNKVIRDNKMWILDDYLVANVDRIIIPNDSTQYNGRGILEVKTAGTWAAKNWIEEPPVEYTFQLQHYLDVLDLHWGEFAVLIGGNDFRHYFIERDDELIALKNEQARKFWFENVLKKNPPDPVNSKDIETIYSRIEAGKVIEAAEPVYATVEELRGVKQRIKELESKEAEYTERLKLLMRDADALMFRGETLVSWKQSKDSVLFDAKRLQKEKPEIYNQYLSERAGSRRFMVK
jgi:putative phage-type endonuclease